MKTSNLHDLIQSLSMSEKRYFKVFSNKHVIGKGNNYIKLFDLLDRQQTYNDKAVKKASFVKNAAAEKNYLYNLILKALNSFHSQLNSRVKIYQQLHSAEILYQKGLYKQCEKILVRTRKLAEDTEHLDLQLAIGALEEELYAKRLDYTEALAKLDKNYACLDHLRNMYDLQQIATQTYQERLNIGGPRKQEHIKAIEKLKNHPRIADEEYAQTPKAKLYQLAVRASYHRVNSSKEEDLKYSAQIIEHYEKHPYLIEHTPIGYITSLYNLCLTLQATSQFKETFKVIAKMEALKNDNKVTQSAVALARVFFLSTNLKIFILLKLNHFDEALDEYHKMKKEFNKHEYYSNKPQLYDLYFMLGKLFLAQKDYKKALFYTNIILNDTQFKVRADLISIIRLFNLILHFEKGNDFTLDYLATATFQYFKRKDRLFQVETLVIKFLQGYGKLHSRTKKQVKWKALKEALDEIKTDPLEQKAFTFFDFSKWVQSKIDGVEIKDVFEKQELT